MKVVGKRGFGLFRSGNKKQRSRSASVLEGIAKANGGGGGAVVSCKEEDGVVRMRIVVKKSDLKQLIHAMNGGAGNRPSSLTAEQRLNALRKKHISKGNAANRRSKCWSPALYSIPEEELWPYYLLPSSFSPFAFRLGPSFFLFFF